MKDDYLWDRSGQPDPEIKQLEDMLAELRYQPCPLEIPERLQTGRNRFLYPRFAIAAAVAMVLLGLGLWLAIQRQQPADVTAGNPRQAKPKDVKAENPQEPNKEHSETAAANPIDEKKLSSLSASNNTPAPQVITNDRQPRRDRTANTRRPSKTLRTPRMSAEELAEAELAKERLMLALRLASSKLKFAQKKMQGIAPANQTHNQHRIG